MLKYLLLGLVFFSNAVAAAIPSSTEFFKLTGVPQHKIDQLDQGEIISHNILESSDKEFGMSIAVYLKTPVKNVIDYMRSIDLFAVDSDVTAYGAITQNSNDFKAFSYSAKQIDEAIDLLNTGEGDRFNLSSQEKSSFSALQNRLTNADSATLASTISQKYREILQQRWRAYRYSGLNGIDDYSRDDGVASPATELSYSVASCKVLTHFFPELFQSWIHYPTLPLSDVEEHYYWINRKVENRPTAILSHNILQKTSTGAVIVGRQFYVGHSYNSSHMCVGILPYRDGSIVYYVHSSSTDQVSGFASGLKHAIARQLLKNQMIEHLEKLSRNFQTVSRAD